MRKQRRPRFTQPEDNMITVTLRDVFFNGARGEAWLVLADQTGRRGQPIFVGSWDARVIAYASWDIAVCRRLNTED
jgi:hypothetical protein